MTQQLSVQVRNYVKLREYHEQQTQHMTKTCMLGIDKLAQMQDCCISMMRKVIVKNLIQGRCGANVKLILQYSVELWKEWIDRVTAVQREPFFKFTCLQAIEEVIYSPELYSKHLPHIL